jgi:hypothetical protein
MKAFLSKQNPLMLAGGVVLIIGAVYFLGGKTLKAAAQTAGGIVSGNNALTQGTVYEDKGILGTLGSAANEASGGFLETTGSKIGGWVYDVLNPGAGR